MNWSDYLLWACMIIQIIVLFLLIKLVTDFLNRFQTQVGIIKMIHSSEEDKEEDITNI
ncbi:hypothetical protein SAMN04488168_11730 [Bacillus sp. 491mf]|uniref:hypothetical protein n=1 Tax=Bacillus sp. 491mf TaxID=1761755 RepID=UPI0008E3485F|nr:hypothetical protein [Bacillus sp. 491mf]SFD08250.1 hypothetical protein SAMN04488168_11730 [Bacillus sp. 491mf]